MPLVCFASVSAQGVVISQSDLLHIPVSGLIKVQSPVKEGLQSKLVPPAPKPEAKTIVPAPMQTGPCNQEVDVSNVSPNAILCIFTWCCSSQRDLSSPR